jgi:hypothetical protein
LNAVVPEIKKMGMRGKKILQKKTMHATDKVAETHRNNNC